MMKTRKIFLLILMCSNLFAESQITLNLYKNDSIYELNSGDIVFKDDKLKFNIESSKDEKIQLFYKTNNNTLKILEKI